MRTRFLLVSSFLFFSTLAYSQVRITVMDPQGAVVSGAQVSLVAPGTSRPAATQVTAGDGVASFGNKPGQYLVQVLAPGFAPVNQTVDVGPQPLVVKLSLATASRTVVVSATATPIVEQQAGVPAESLGSAALANLQSTSAADALRFLPGVVINNAGQRGGQSSLFVRGGESRYNRVLVDGVPVNDPGGFFDFGVIPISQFDRVEMVRGPASTNYGSDAMTSVVQFFSATGHTRRPELTVGADGGTFHTAHGYGNLSGAASRFDYNVFADQFNTEGSGPNDQYRNTSEGANVGIALAKSTLFRVRVRHSVNASGVQNDWWFNGAPLLKPDTDQFANQNNLTASGELSWFGAQWQHRVTVFDYTHHRTNIDNIPDRGCDFTAFVFTDCPFGTQAKFNRAGLDYQGSYRPRTWLQTTFGYAYEDEHGDERDPVFGSQQDHGLRHQHDFSVQQLFTKGRLSATAGARYVRNDSFGHTTVPRATVAFTAFRGGHLFSGTRLRFAAGSGIQVPDFIETFGSPAFLILPNPNLHPERNRSLETGFTQSFSNRFELAATYFNNSFHNRIEYTSLGPPTYFAKYLNLDRVLSHGAEVELHGRITSKFALQSGYVYTSTQVLSAANDPSLVGTPLLRRPKHSGNFLVTFNDKRFGVDFGGTFIGRRPDSDFQGFNIDHAAGYARADAGAWYAFSRRATAYINLENAFDKRYNEVVGYPALGRNVRAGLRYRLGGE